MTKSYHELEASTYKNVRNKNLSRIHGMQTWRHNEDLLLEAGEVSLGCDVHCDWAGKFGLHATIIGLLHYLAEVGLNYVKPVQPPIIYPPHI